jgi:hypothetical protein
MKAPLIALALAGGTATLAAGPVEAQRYNNWRVIGYETVNGHDTDIIRVRGDARFRQIRLCVAGGPIRMRDLDVRFANGRRQDVAVRNRFVAGSCTRNIDLAGNRRDIVSVRMKYDPIARGYRRPLVRVQAR